MLGFPSSNTVLNLPKYCHAAGSVHHDQKEEGQSQHGRFSCSSVPQKGPHQEGHHPQEEKATNLEKVIIFPLTQSFL